jgi:hypothetical protein
MGERAALAVTFGDHQLEIVGIRASHECIFFHGAELGFGLHNGEVLRLHTHIHLVACIYVPQVQRKNHGNKYWTTEYQ